VDNAVVVVSFALFTPTTADDEKVVVLFEEGLSAILAPRIGVVEEDILYNDDKTEMKIDRISDGRFGWSGQ
jgi:hypothetical protein